MCFGHDDHLLFATCFWQKKREPNIFYFGYRIFIAFYFALTFGMAFADMEGDKRKIFINNTGTFRCDGAWVYAGHFTQATYVYILVQALLALILVSISVGYYLKKKEIFNFETVWVKVLCVFYWIFNIIAVDFIISQQYLFWYRYYTSIKVYGMIQKDGGSLGKHIFVYGSNTIFILIDFFMVAHPVKGSQCWVPFVIGHIPITIVFNGLYFGKTIKECVESTFNDSQPYDLTGGLKLGFFMNSMVFMSVFIVVTAVLVILVHLCFWGLYKLKLCFHSPPKASSSDANADTT